MIGWAPPRGRANASREFLPKASLRLRSFGAVAAIIEPVQAVRERDRGIRRISVLTRAIAVGSVGLSAGFAALMALAQPARARTTTPVKSGLPTAKRPVARTPRPRHPVSSTTAPPSDTPSTPTGPTPTAPPMTNPPITNPPATAPTTSDPYSGSYLAPPQQSPSLDSGGGSVVVSGQS